MSAKDVWSPSPALKLRAEDVEDLAVLSACVQDAVIPLGDMAYLPDENRFVLVANRFRWEAKGDGARSHFERVHCGLCFDQVVGVKRRGIAEDRRSGFLNLLAIELVEDNGDCAGPVVQLTFSGAAAIRLETRGLLCHLEDLGESWPTKWRPSHPGD